MRIATIFRKLLGLQALRVLDVEFHLDALTLFIDVAPRHRLRCGRCHKPSKASTYDSKKRLWRHLDLGPWALYLRSQLRRFRCSHCNFVVTESVPWADLGSAFTRDFEDVVSFLAQQANQTAVSRLLKIAWPTVGNIVRRTVGRHHLPLRFRRLYRIGIDEISYRKHHKYLTLVADHITGQIVWGGKGKSGTTLDAFLDALGQEGCRTIELVSLDMSAAFISKLGERLPNATLCFDPFHVIKLANAAIDEVRRSQVRALQGQEAGRAIKKARWLLLKANENLDPKERQRLARIGIVNRPLYRAYLLKEALRDVYTASAQDASQRLNAWLAWASRSKLQPFVKLARTIRQHRQGVLAAIEHGLSNGRLEGLNRKVDPAVRTPAARRPACGNELITWMRSAAVDHCGSPIGLRKRPRAHAGQVAGPVQTYYSMPGRMSPSARSCTAPAAPGVQGSV